MRARTSAKAELPNPKYRLEKEYVGALGIEQSRLLIRKAYVKPSKIKVELPVGAPYRPAKEVRASKNEHI